MDDSGSDTSHDEVKPAFYKITPEELRKMKHSLEVMRHRLGAHIDPVLQEFEDLKASITEAEPASENLITPESSDSDSVPESGRSATAVCDILVTGGVSFVFARMIEQLEIQKDETSARIVDFIDSYIDIANVAENDGKHELLVVIEEAMEADSNFVKEFGIRTKKILSDFITQKMTDALIKGLTEAFSKI